MGNIRYKGGNYTRDARSSYVVVEPLSVTSNGTYTAESGKAYNPVTVNVEPPKPITKKDVNFYDYDGTIVANYTKEQFLALTELPANPTHERLVSQGWNYSLQDAKDYVEKYGSLNIGQMYTTASGALEIDIELHEGRLHPYLGLNINGSVTVDWGDGTATDTMTGSSLSTNVRKDHIYSEHGAYTIKVFADEETSVAIVGGSGFSNILTHSTLPSQNSPTKSYNSSIIKICIANFITSISNNAFTACCSLASITIPKGVTSIGAAAFSSCYLLASITIPDSVTSLNDSAFQNCPSLASIALPDSVTSIGSSMFTTCSSLSSITIPEDATSVGAYMFKDCSSLASITLPDKVTSIGSSAFQNCSSLASIALPDKVTSIGSSAFQNCSSLASIALPDRVTSISIYTFTNCFSLTSIALPDKVTSIGSSAFQNCSSLASIALPDRVTSLNASAFQNCFSLTSIALPDKVTSLNDSAFQDCSSLTSITIPDSIVNIYSGAFRSCCSLGFIKFESITPPTVSGSSAWSNVPSDCIIYVPTGTIEAYKAKANMPNPSTYTYVEYTE